ncbi:MAG: hypothetical protein ACXWZM_05935 [Solirubrobacterales bacterium]
MRRPEPPKFLSDVYRDLRDRHLLLPAIGLLVALVAVPMLLKTTSEPTVAPPVSTAEDDAAATIPAVLAASEVSVRDYRVRLEDLKSKNPFKQQFQTSDTTAAGGTGTDPGSTTGLPGGTGATLPSDPAAPTGGLPGASGDEPSQNDVDVVTQLYTRRIDVAVGVQGDLHSRKNVKPMTILPSNANPVLAFLGTDEAGKRAAFVVSSDVTSVGGDGACVPSLANCLYITLEKGESATFDYAPDGQTYELRLKAIRNVRLKTD